MCPVKHFPLIYFDAAQQLSRIKGITLVTRYLDESKLNDSLALVIETVYHKYVHYIFICYALREIYSKLKKKLLAPQINDLLQYSPWKITS